MNCSHRPKIIVCTLLLMVQIRDPARKKELKDCVVFMFLLNGKMLFINLRNQLSFMLKPYFCTSTSTEIDDLCSYLKPESK